MESSDHPLARFFIPMAEARERISWVPFPRTQRDLCFRGVQEHDVCAWIDEPWPIHGASPPIEREAYPVDFQQTRPGVGLVVIEKPIATKHSISICYDELFGFHEDRVDATVLFLGEVWARDVNVVPNNIAIFAAGLRVQRIALFDGLESRTSVGHVLEAPLVVSAFRGGVGDVTPKCSVSVGAYTGWIGNLPEHSAGKSFDAVHEMLPFFEKHGVATTELEDGVFPWRIFETHYKNAAFPRSFTLPKLPPFRTQGPPPKRKPAAKKTTAKAKKTTAKKRGDAARRG